MGRLDPTLKQEITIPKEYTSGFSFFKDCPDTQKDISIIEAEGVSYLYRAMPHSTIRFAHELWTIGKFPVVKQAVQQYGVKLEKDDLIFEGAVMTKVGGVSNEECAAFFHDSLLTPIDSPIEDDEAHTEQEIQSMMYEVESLEASLA